MGMMGRVIAAALGVMVGLVWVVPLLTGLLSAGIMQIVQWLVLGLMAAISMKYIGPRLPW